MKPPSPESIMRLALSRARENLSAMEGGPFGAAVEKGGRVLSVSRNLVLKKDATCHAEINAIRQASRILGTYDLTGCVIYSTTEPCPMCFSAIHWARIGNVYFGTDISDAAGAGFNEMPVSNALLAKLGKSPVKIFPGFLRDECLELLKDWESIEDRVLY